MGDRLPVFRQRLQCGANDADPGIAGYTLFVLGYLGDDSGSKSFLQTQVDLGGDIGTIAKAALYLMGDTSQKDAVQTGAKSSSVWVKVACAGALGIVDKDDTSVNSAIIPEVKWIEPDNMGGDTDNGKGMYSAHILEIVAFDRRGWVYRGNAEGPVTFYGETAGGTGGSSGAGGSSAGAGGSSGAGGSLGAGGSSGTGGNTANRDAGSAPSGSGGAVNSGGRSGSGGATAGSGGSPGAGGASGVGGSMGNGGQKAGGAQSQGSGGAAGSGGGGNGAGGSSGQGGVAGAAAAKASDGCKCNLSGRPDVPAFSFLALTGLALLLVRRRRH